MVCGELFIPFEGPKYKLFLFYIKLTGQHWLVNNRVKEMLLHEIDIDCIGSMKLVGKTDEAHGLE